MFTIILSVVIGFLVSIIGLVISPYSWIVGLGIAFVGTIISLFPIEGYCDKQLYIEYELIKLEGKDRKQGKYYVQVKGKKAYFAFDNRQEYNLSGKAYEEKCVRGNVKIYESSECKNPILKIYKRKPITEDDYAWAPFATKTEYVFYVPEQTVLGKVSKKDYNGEITINSL